MALCTLYFLLLFIRLKICQTSLTYNFLWFKFESLRVFDVTIPIACIFEYNMPFLEPLQK